MTHLSELAQVTLADAIKVKRTAREHYTHWSITRHVRERIVRPATALQRIDGPSDVVRLCDAIHMQEWAQESFMILCLDAQHHVIGREIVEVSRGDVSSTVVHPREVFRAAIIASASSIVLIHNHPSGDPTPSTADRVVTDNLCNAGRMLGIAVRDHIIIGRGRYVSFSEAGWLSYGSAD